MFNTGDTGDDIIQNGHDIGHTLARFSLQQDFILGQERPGRTDLSDQQWKQIDDAIAFYRRIAPVVKDGYSFLYENRGRSGRHLSGWQALVRVQTREGAYRCAEEETAPAAYAVIHHFASPEGEKPERIEIPLPPSCPREIKAVYAGTPARVRIEEGKLIAQPTACMEAVAVYLEKR